VGEGLRRSAPVPAREDVFLQTKFTYVNGQDHRLPYDPRAPLATQVEQSFASSLAHWASITSTRTCCTARRCATG
jgi:hypothetical protein